MIFLSGRGDGESKDLSVREDEKGGGVFNIEKVYIYLNKLCDWRVTKVWFYFCSLLLTVS